MSALMSDVIDGSLNPGIVNAAANVGGKLLKVVEMNHKYGRRPDGKSSTDLLLVDTDQSVA